MNLWTINQRKGLTRSILHSEKPLIFYPFTGIKTLNHFSPLRGLKSRVNVLFLADFMLEIYYRYHLCNCLISYTINDFCIKNYTFEYHKYILGDFRRKRNQAFVPIFRRNRKDFHGNPISQTASRTAPELLLSEFSRSYHLENSTVSREPAVFPSFFFPWLLQLCRSSFTSTSPQIHWAVCIQPCP